MLRARIVYQGVDAIAIFTDDGKWNWEDWGGAEEAIEDDTSISGLFTFWQKELSEIYILDMK